MQASTYISSLKVLRIDASARIEGSVTRRLADGLLDALGQKLGSSADGVHVVHRDLSQGLPILDAEWVTANFTDTAQRSAAQRQALSLSDALVEEVKAADLLVIATPIYNFSVPSTLKAWVDQIARARVTFRYTDNGPEGLLTGKKAYVLLATGGTEVGGEMDFATPWLRFMLAFLGITDVAVIAADLGMPRGEAALRNAEEQVNRLLEKDWPQHSVPQQNEPEMVEIA